MSFEDRLKAAIARGESAKQASSAAEADAALSEESARTRHTEVRLALSNSIERQLREIADHFPGFSVDTVLGDAGWGARIQRTDVVRGDRRGQLSRLEVAVRPFTKTRIVEVTAKGTIRNRETIQRSHFEHLHQAELSRLEQVVENWVLEFAEQFAAVS